MNEKDLYHYKSRLLALREELLEQKKSAKESTKAVSLDQSSVGRLSRMDAMQSQQMALAGNRRREIQLTRIKAALDRIEEEEFGFCASCDEEISRGRLDIDPANPFCIDCAEKL